MVRGFPIMDTKSGLSHYRGEFDVILDHMVVPEKASPQGSDAMITRGHQNHSVDN